MRELVFGLILIYALLTFTIMIVDSYRWVLMILDFFGAKTCLLLYKMNALV